MTKADWAELVPKRIWECPETGFGEFQNVFEYIYNTLHGNTIEESEHQNDTASDLAARLTWKYIEKVHNVAIMAQTPFIVKCPKCLTFERFNCIQCYSAIHNDKYNDPFEPFREPMMCMICGETYRVDKNMRFI